MSVQSQIASKALGEYRRKRSFDATPEPAPELGAPDAGGGARFVVHEHHARRLHWDLRLEHEGALASWAVPNGIPEDPKHNRKAVHVEDHPLSYIDFEGTIPVGNYGAGEVTVWDHGTYSFEKWEPGKIVVVFHGKRLSGRYALFRAGRSEKDWMIHRMDAADGRPSFQALQPRMHLRGEAAVKHLAESSPVTYAIFDLLWLDGHSLAGLPYTERRSRLDALELNAERWRVPEFQAGEGSGLLAATREQGLEGVVAKRLESRYTPGGRTGGWLKIKNSQRQELVVGGWTAGNGSRSKGIGALHLGVHGEAGELRYAGRVGTGFDAEELTRLAGLLEPLAQKASPFVGAQPPKGAHFVKPMLVCEVEFTEWTRAGTLRHPSYKGLREDKAAAEVVRERVSAPEQKPATASPPRNSPKENEHQQSHLHKLSDRHRARL